MAWWLFVGFGYTSVLVWERRFRYVGIGGTYVGCCVVGWVNVFPSYLVVVGNLGVHTSVLMLYVGFCSYKSVLVFDLVWVFKFFLAYIRRFQSISVDCCVYARGTPSPLVCRGSRVTNCWEAVWWSTMEAPSFRKECTTCRRLWGLEHRRGDFSSVLVKS